MASRFRILRCGGRGGGGGGDVVCYVRVGVIRVWCCTCVVMRFRMLR